MKRPILKGPKLIAVGPLKCFKSTGSSSGGGGGGGGGGTVRDPVYGTAVKVSDVATAKRTGAVTGGDSAGARSRQGRIGAAYDAGTLNQAGGQRDFVQEAARIKQKEDNIKKMMLEDPTAFRGLLDSNDPETAKIAEEAAMGEENKKVDQIKKDIIAKKKIKNLLKGALPTIALDIVGLGAVNLATAMASEFLSPEKKAAIVKSLDDNVPGVKEAKAALAQEPETASDAEISAAQDSGDYDNPDNPNIYSGSPRTQQARVESKGGDKFTPPPIANVQAKTVVEEKVEEGPKTPAAMSEADLTSMLEKRAKGEDSIVEKQAKLSRERGLAQQLASVRGARGATAGQKLRALRRGSQTMEREIQPQVAIAKQQEQQAAQDALLGLKTGDRKQAELFAQQEKLAKLKQPAGGGGGGGRPKPGQDLFGKIKTGFDLYKKGKKLFGGLFEEGGKVEGPGTETSDSIPARLSDGEFVVKASAVRGLGQQMGGQNPQQDRRKGVKFLDSLQDQMGRVGERRGEMKKFGGGGPVKGKEPRKTKYQLLRERQKLEGELKAAGVRYDIKKPKKKKLTVDELVDMGWAEGGEAYVRPKKAFAEAIGHSGEAQFKDKALKDAKKGGSKRRFITHYAEGGKVSFKDVIKARNKKEQDDETNIDDLDWWVESVTD